MTRPDTQGFPGTKAAHIRAARRWAELYHRKGYYPLPSDPAKGKRKKPLCKYAKWWEGGGPPPGWLWDHFPTTNVQVMTGRHWKLAVVDLDGSEAIEAWPQLRPLHGPVPPKTWESTSGGGGRHVWFTLPSSACLGPIPKRVVWRGNGPHSAIELLCDRSLVMAPPSVHPATGMIYRFRAGHSPREIPRPALLPRWVLELAPIVPPKAAPVPFTPMPRPVRNGPSKPLPGGVGRDDVLAAIGDKTAVARSWGLRIVDGTPGPTGWIDCHDYNRADVHPSARWHPEAGLFWRPGMTKPMGLFDLGSEIGGYADWYDCCADLSHQYGVTRP